MLREIQLKILQIALKKHKQYSTMAAGNRSTISRLAAENLYT